ILNKLQLGRYAEYYAKMEFASYGFEVYTSEVDDHGIDFIVKSKDGSFFEIQVKSVRQIGYVFMQKEKWNINNRTEAENFVAKVAPDKIRSSTLTTG
ncbi:MAG: hypothetical protein H6Q13_2908, partial [Bacteroidetes bacterium]|nr:hypothetical protein [Bacteroidota bacterium]